MAEAWLTKPDGGTRSEARSEARAGLKLRATDIAASMAFDSLRTGYAARKAARLAAANGEVLSGVTTTTTS